MSPSFFHHLHPPTIPILQARLRYTLAAGGMAFFTLIITLVTGALEIFYYNPTPTEAPLSIQTISFLIPFGGLIRGLHYWAAQFLVCFAALHLFRVVFTGAYSSPRRLNYWIGMGLFLLITFLNFTGYALRWDEGIRWALVAGTNLLKTIPIAGQWVYALAVGGGELGPASLIRFYAWHCFGLILPAVLLVGWHIFRLRRDGGIAVPPPLLRENIKRITRFELVQREVIAALLGGAIIVCLAALVPPPIFPPLTQPISAPTLVSDQAWGAHNGNPQAPWFFLWVQQLLKLGDPFILGVLIPAGLFSLLAFIPFLFKSPEASELGRWFPAGGRGARVLLALVFSAIFILTLGALFLKS